MRTCPACGQTIEPWFSIEAQPRPVGRCNCDDRRWQTDGKGEWYLIPPGPVIGHYQRS